MSTFYLIWQDPETRQWYPAGRLDRVHGQYVFAYTKAALSSPRFVAFGNLSDRSAVYVSNMLFPIFANRVLSEKRPEYATYARWTGFDGASATDPLMLMARMGGTRATDTLQVYAVPEVTPYGEYRTTFFSHGLSHMANDGQSRSFSLKAGERLFPMHDVQNLYDDEAVALRTSDPASLIGYCPRHLAPDIKMLTKHFASAPEIRVKQVNIDAPPQYRLLCEAVAPWPAGFKPCDGAAYETVTSYDPEQVALQHPYHEPKPAPRFAWQ